MTKNMPERVPAERVPLESIPLDGSPMGEVPTERAAGVFGKGQDHRTNGEAALISRWRRHVCQLEVGLEFLAKRSRP